MTAVAALSAHEQAAFRRFLSRGWAVFSERNTDAAGAYAAWCATTGQPLVAVERLDGRWWVLLDTATACREPSAQELAVVSRLARRAGAGLVVEIGMGIAAHVPDFRTAARLASMVASALGLEGGGGACVIPFWKSGFQRRCWSCMPVNGCGRCRQTY